MPSGDGGRVGMRPGEETNEVGELLFCSGDAVSVGEAPTLAFGLEGRTAGWATSSRGTIVCDSPDDCGSTADGRCATSRGGDERCFRAVEDAFFAIVILI